MHSLEVSFLSRLEFPAEISAGLSSLNQLRKQSNPLLANVSSLPHQNLKHVSEVARKGYLEALAFIHQSRPAFNIETLLMLHQKIFYYLDGSGGHFKSQDNFLQSTDGDGKKAVVHTPYSAAQIPQAMDKFFSNYDLAIQSYDPLIVIPLTLMDFIFIHPFMDGNGRMFHMLSVLLLYHAGFECALELNFDSVLQNSRSSGQKALATAVPGWREGKHNVLAWVTYFVGALSYAHARRAALVS